MMRRGATMRVRAGDVGDEPAHARPVADPVKPPGDHRQRLIAGQEARHQHHGPPVAVRDAATGEHRIDQQSRQLQRAACLGQRSAPPWVRQLDARGSRGMVRSGLVLEECGALDGHEAWT
jgi:hypothetical protein